MHRLANRKPLLSHNRTLSHLGIEKSKAIELYPTKNLYGLNLLAEFEIAPFPLFSVGLQYNYLLLNGAITNPQKISIKARVYFNKS